MEKNLYSMDPRSKCGNCANSHRVDSVYVECRAHPPVIGVNAEGFEFPLIKADKWCAEGKWAFENAGN